MFLVMDMQFVQSFLDSLGVVAIIRMKCNWARYICIFKGILHIEYFAHTHERPDMFN